jgi:excisionase family DNA binding protein
MNDYEQLATVKELAQHLKVPESWIYDKTKRGGDIPVKRIGKYLRFSLSDVEDWLEKKYGNRANE